ncbi:MAG: ribonuclease Y [Deltaproteobacteria bacterium]
MWIMLATVFGVAIGVIGHFLFMTKIDKKNLELKMGEAESIIQIAKKESDKIKVEGELRAKEALERAKGEIERDAREKQNELRERQREFSKTERKLQNREEALDRKYETLEKRESDLSHKERDVAAKDRTAEEKQRELDAIVEEAKRKIEEIAGMTQEAAKRELVSIVENEARHDSAKKLKLIEDELHETSERRAKDIIALAIQKYAGQYTSEKTISVVNLPSDDMKGRIIGREGRNIRSIESRTGVDIIIDDTPGTVVISSLNPIRREVAKVALERLIGDGRIHPARIEEVVAEVEQEIEKEIQKTGEEAVFDIGAHGMHTELVKLVGKLKYRSSYSQNILSHSMEVSFICGVIAAELGLNTKLARRIGLLHDIGKALDHEIEGSHVEIGAEIVRKYGEPWEVIESVSKYHDPQPQLIWAVLVQAADAISAARPGARREMYEAYVKRIEDIERIGSSFRGVEKCYAIQAGREVRVIVESSKVNDEESVLLSNEIAKKIEREVAYPGQIKITVVREVRASSYAT